jgi:predicted  nucleic acid-binding Zn-ribbon protein
VPQKCALSVDLALESLAASTMNDRQEEFFRAQRETQRAEAEKKAKEEEELLAAMTEEEREEFLANKEREAIRLKKKDASLTKGMTSFKAATPVRGGRGRGRGRGGSTRRIQGTMASNADDTDEEASAIDPPPGLGAPSASDSRPPVVPPGVRPGAAKAPPAPPDSGVTPPPGVRSSTPPPPAGVRDPPPGIQSRPSPGPPPPSDVPQPPGGPVPGARAPSPHPAVVHPPPKPSLSASGDSAQQLADLQRQLDTALKQYASLELEMRRVSSLNEELERARDSSLETAQSANQTLQENSQKLRDLLAKLQAAEELNATLASRNRSLQAEVDRGGAEQKLRTRTAEEERMRVEQRLEAVESERKELLARLITDAEKHKREMQSLQDQYEAERSEQLSASDRKEQALRNSLREAETTSRQELERLNHQLNESRREVRDAQETMRRKDDECLRISRELAQTKSSLEEELGQARSRVASLSTADEAGAAEIQRLTHEVGVAQAEARQALTDLESARARISQFVEQERGYVTRVQDLEQALLVERQAKERMESDSEQGLATRADLENRLAQAERALANAKQDHSDLQSELRDTKARLQAADDAARTAQAGAEQEQSDLEAQLRAAQAEAVGLRQQLETVSKDLEGSQAESEAREVELAEPVPTNDGEEQERSELLQQIAEMESRISDLRQIKEDLDKAPPSVATPSPPRVVVLPMLRQQQVDLHKVEQQPIPPSQSPDRWVVSSFSPRTSTPTTQTPPAHPTPDPKETTHREPTEKISVTSVLHQAIHAQQRVFSMLTKAQQEAAASAALSSQSTDAEHIAKVLRESAALLEATKKREAARKPTPPPSVKEEVDRQSNLAEDERLLEKYSGTPPEANTIQQHMMHVVNDSNGGINGGFAQEEDMLSTRFSLDQSVDVVDPSELASGPIGEALRKLEQRMLGAYSPSSREPKRASLTAEEAARVGDRLYRSQTLASQIRDISTAAIYNKAPPSSRGVFSPPVSPSMRAKMVAEEKRATMRAKRLLHAVADIDHAPNTTTTTQRKHWHLALLEDDPVTSPIQVAKGMRSEQPPPPPPPPPPLTRPKQLDTRLRSKVAPVSPRSPSRYDLASTKARPPPYSPNQPSRHDVG